VFAIVIPKGGTNRSRVPSGATITTGTLS
jgi:hypothetical protein